MACIKDITTYYVLYAFRYPSGDDAGRPGGTRGDAGTDGDDDSGSEGDSEDDSGTDAEPVSRERRPLGAHRGVNRGVTDALFGA